ncbi:efflux RND transporter permease subunit [Helicobacter anatolicus]|uniref:efflux RND transporter permease subunit n=1 Tax=Helicobacter anatolicus TaxID=2905874 RepID=UPI001E336909|nr:efflux RND transporter permease subunit [Helicobacter anatolicus]MCE3039293.1 efflux RND transporter permease subunit [Helicobacter anatolicus]
MYKFAIQRPITTLMFALAIMFFGILGLKKIPISLFPNVDFPIIVVSTAYPGGSPEIIESKVTDKIEEAVMGIDGIKSVKSNSARNISIVIVEFQLEKPIQEAMNDVIGKISSIKFGDANIQQPSIQKFDTSGQAIISLFMTSQDKSASELMKQADLVVKPMLQKISGVGGVQLNGYRERQMRVYVDPTLMNKYNLTYNSLFSLLGQENIEVNGGRIENATKDFTITIDANGYSIEEIGNIRVGQSTKLSDIAVIEDGLEEETTYAAYQNEPGVIFEVQKVSGANEIDIADGVYKVLPQIQAVSQGYEIRPFLDTTEYIRHSIKDVEFDLILGGILAVLIVFFFLRSITITLVAAISLPVSILGTFALIQMMGYTLNMLTMMALTLAIGIIIDDAIVVIENIHKKLEKGMSKKEAAYEGVREIAFAIIAISAMLLSVFIPIGNMSGIMGRFFESFGVTVALAVIISYVVVITIIPMVSSLIVSSKQSKFYYFTEPFFNRLQSFYATLLSFVLKQKTIFIVLIFLIFGFSLYLAKSLGGEFMLQEDKSEFYVWMETKPGISIHEMKKKTIGLQELLKKHDEIVYTTIQVGYGTIQSVFKSKIYVKLKPVQERSVSQFELMDIVQKELRTSPLAQGLNIFASEVPTLGGGDNTAFQMTIYGATQEMVDKSVEKLRNFLLESETFKGKIGNYHTSTSDIQPEYRITILRQNADKYGVSAQTIGNAINAAFSGTNQAAYFKENGKEYKITMRVPNDKRISPDDIKKIQVQNAKGELMFLDGLVEIKHSQSPSLISRYSRQRSVTVYAAPLQNSGISLGDIIAEVSKPENMQTLLEDGVGYAFGGQSDNMSESVVSFGVAVITAFILIYLILAALYESLIEPLIIMITMPLSFAGAFFALKIVNQPFSIFSFMGLILLIGIVGKNATLLIDVANERRKKFQADVYEAIKFAGESRLRPILMTTIAMVFGMLPLAIATGSGYAMKSPIGISMIGGLLISMVLSLLIVPILYVLVAPLDDKIKRLYQREEGNIVIKKITKAKKVVKKIVENEELDYMDNKEEIEDKKKVKREKKNKEKKKDK